MADLTHLTSLVTLLKTITTQPDGSARPLILINGQEPGVDSSGSSDSGIITVVRRLFHGDLNQNVLKKNDRSVYECDYGSYLVNATTTYAKYVDVLENISSVFGANNADGTNNGGYFYYMEIVDEDVNQLVPYTRFQVTIIRKQVTANS